MQAQIPLKRHRVFQSRNLDAARDYLTSKEFFLDVAPRDAGDFDLVASAAYLPGSYIGAIHYGPDISIRLPPNRARNDFWIHVPLRGRFEVTNRAGSLACDPIRSAISSPEGHSTRSEAGSARLTLSVSKPTMLAQLGALLGEPTHRELDFEPTFDLAAAPGRRLRRQLGLMVAELDEETQPAPVMLAMYEQILVTGLLLGQPNSHSAALHRLAAYRAPGDVRRAIDYIEAHLDAPVTLAAIAQASGVPGRTLLQHFKDSRGVSPMRYLRDARFARAREALMRQGGEASVTEIAMALGFNHLGRFAFEYRRRFGESPSETLRRR